MAIIYKALAISGSRHLSNKDFLVTKQNKKLSSNKTSIIDANVDAIDIPENIIEPVNNSDNHLKQNLLDQLTHNNKQLNDDLISLKNELQIYKNKEAVALSQQASMENESRLKAFEMGRAEGNKAGILEYQIKINALISAMQIFDQRLNDETESTKLDAVLIAYEALVLIVGENYKDKSFLQGLIETAISKIGDRKRITLFLSPSDMNCVTEILAETSFNFKCPVTLEADERIKLGGCIIQTDIGSWDARLESQLDRIKDALVIAEEGLH